MPDGLPAVLAGVEDDPVPGVLDAFGHGDLPGRANELVKQPGARCGKFCHIGEVIPGDQQDVRRRLGVDVTEGEYPLPVQHYRGRDLPGSDPAEQAIWHTTIIVAAGCVRCWTIQEPLTWPA